MRLSHDSSTDMAYIEFEARPSLEDLELATLEWVDWFNHRRLSSAIGYVPPAEYEASQYCESVPAPARTQ